MATYDFDQDGIRRLGGFIREQMEDQGITIESLVRQCAEVGYTTNAPKIIRLRSGVGLEPPVGLLWAIARLEFIKHPNGTPFSLEDLLSLACSDPKSQSLTTKDDTATYQDDDHPYPAAVRELRRLIGRRSVKTVAKEWDLPPERLEELLTTKDPNRAIPSLIEVHRIVSKAYPDKLANRLLDLYVENKVNGKAR